MLSSESLANKDYSEGQQKMTMSPLPVHMLNYGGFVLIPTLYHNQTEQREPVRTKKKYLVGILGTLALTLPEIVATYWFVYNVLLKGS